MIYLDNAAGTYPKPQQVKSAMAKALDDYGANPGRGAYAISLETARMVYQTRILTAELFGCPAPERLIFTSGATESLNIALRGALKQGDHVVYSGMEHNALWRPLMDMQAKGVIESTCVKADRYGYLSLKSFKEALRPNTKMIACMHASNVTGSVQPIVQLGELAQQNGLLFLVDTAQSAGLLPISVQKIKISLLVFAGHKYLYGPAGIGGLYVAEGVQVEPFIRGGTGSLSTSWQQPDIYPDHLESGTLNVLGIAGLKAAVEFVKECGVDTIYQRTMALCQHFAEGADSIAGVKLYLPRWQVPRVPVVSLNIPGVLSSEVAARLDEGYQIAVRSGLHCAPLAHNAIGTDEAGGTVRFSWGCFNTENDVEQALLSLRALAKEYKKE